MENQRRAKVKKSLTLGQNAADDLQTLSEFLGVNAHAYIVNEIAKCIQRDMKIYNLKQSQEKNL